MFHAPTSDSKQQGDRTTANPTQQKQGVYPSLDESLVLGIPPVAGAGPSSPTPTAPRRQKLARLQRAYGNQAVLRMLRTAAIQPKLVVSEPGDAHEQEADRVAAQVMGMSEPAAAAGWNSQSRPTCSTIQRACALCGEEEKKIQAKAAPGQIRTLAPALEAQVTGLEGTGHPLPQSARDFFEPRFGRDFSDVRVHAGAKASESAHAVNALAYTVGRDIVFAAGTYAPDTTRGRHLLAHELAHTIQQSRDYIQRQDDGGGGEDVSVTVPSPSQDQPDPSSQLVVNVEGHAEPQTAKRALFARTSDAVFFNGNQLVIKQSGAEVLRVTAVSGHPDERGQFEPDEGPIPDGIYVISPQMRNPPVNAVRGAPFAPGVVCGAPGIDSGFQELSSSAKGVCPPDLVGSWPCCGEAECDTAGTDECWSPVCCWGTRRVRIEGSAIGRNKAGKTVTRSGFFIHGGSPRPVTSGCIKVFDDSVFDQLIQFTQSVPLIVENNP